MIQQNQFISLVCKAIPRFSKNAPNRDQQTAILSDVDLPLMIIAGPGSGKTTVLVLRALRLVFVEGMLPEEIVITTFTRKAAEELRSRLIEWGLLIQAYLMVNPTKKTAAFSAWLKAVDVNRFVTGTLDKLCEDILTSHRDPMDAAPVLVEGFVGNALLARKGLFSTGAHSNQHLKDYLEAFTHNGDAPSTFGEVLSVTRTVLDRLIQDQVDVDHFARAKKNREGREAVRDAYRAYRTYMETTNRFDFARMEELFFERLRANRLIRFTSGIKALLVDEYQDTNPLQESIYFELVKKTKASFTVVGDDDQSLYRFRGATVELFRDFVKRLKTVVPSSRATKVVYLVENYRSTPPIVDFFNGFITNDPAFTPARVQPPKPRIKANNPGNGLPVLGMFRSDINTLASDLAGFLVDTFRGPGYQVGAHRVKGYAKGGDFGDAVFLAHTVNEYGRSFMGQPPKVRLPQLLRQQLGAHGFDVFNPRGRALRDILAVQQLVGVLLDCIDAPDRTSPYGVIHGRIVAKHRLRGEAVRYMESWRDAGRAFIGSNPTPNRPHSIRDFVTDWQKRQSRTGKDWPTEWPVLELCFKLITWFPFFQDDPEGQVYLEAVSRCIAQAATFSPYGSLLMHGQGLHDGNSIEKAITDIFGPLAENAIEVDEEVMPSIPRERLPIMTIHQSKGLEFPLVIVDVGSDFSRNHPKQRFRRFPDVPSAVQLMEDDLAPYCPIGSLRQSRPALARTFDDLIRLYYVAYSRAQSVLMLVGLDANIAITRPIQNVPLWFRQDGSWAWNAGASGITPTVTMI